MPVLGVPNARFWLDGPPEPLLAEVEATRRRRAASGLDRRPETHVLALSGGGDDGAFGAGLVTGWTESDARPEFDVVTGVSAGALIAPFAFLGPEYDPALRAVFTEVRPADVLVAGRVVLAVLFRDAVADTSPLARLIERHADEALLAAVAREYGRGGCCWWPRPTSTSSARPRGTSGPSPPRATPGRWRCSGDSCWPRPPSPARSRR